MKTYLSSSTGGVQTAAAVSLVIPEKFQYNLQVCNTSTNARRNIAFAIPAIKGVGRGHAHVVLREAHTDLNKTARELAEDEVEGRLPLCRIHTSKDSRLFLQQKDVKNGKCSKIQASVLDNNPFLLSILFSPEI